MRELIKLTPKQEKFCQEYVKTGNKSEAFRIAYDCSNSTEETVNVNAVKLSKNTKVSPRIKELQDQAKERNNIDIDWCLTKLKAIVEDDSNDRVAAVDKIIKHLGGYEKNNDQKSTKINLSRFTDEEIEQKLKEIANDTNKF